MMTVVVPASAAVAVKLTSTALSVSPKCAGLVSGGAFVVEGLDRQFLRVGEDVGLRDRHGHVLPGHRGERVLDASGSGNSPLDWLPARERASADRTCTRR